MTLVTRTIIAGGGGDYTDITSWEFDTNLNSGADIWQGVISDNSAYDESVTIDVDGTGTSSYVWLTAASGNRHAGIAGTGHARINYTGANTAAVQIDADWARVDWLEITRPASGSIGNSDEGIRVASATQDVLLDYLIIWTDDDGAQPQTDGIYTGNWDVTRLRVSNSVIYGWARGGIHLQDFGGTNTQTSDFDHLSLGPNGEGDGSLHLQDSGGGNTCTVHNSWISCADIVGTGTGANILLGDAGITLNLTNCAWDHANDSYGSSTVNETSVQNASDDLVDTAPGTAGIYISDAGYPTSFDATLVDHANNVCIANGTNRQGSEPDARQDFSVAINGSRGTTGVDIGAFQVSGGSPEGTASLDSTADLTGAGSRTSDGTASLDATADLAGTGARDSAGTGALDATADLAGTGQADAAGTASLDSTAALAGTGQADAAGTGALDATATLDGTGQRDSEGSASLDATGALAGTGQRDSTGTAALDATAALAGVGEAPAEAAEGTASLDSTADLAGTGQRDSEGSASLASSADLGGVGARDSAGAAATAADASLTATGARDSAGDASLDTTAVLAGTGQADAEGVSALDSTAALAGVGQADAEGTASLDTTAAIDAIGSSGTGGFADLDSTAALDATGARDSTGDATLDTTAALAGEGARGSAGTASLDTTATLAGTGAAPTEDAEGAASLDTTATLAGTGARDAAGVAALDSTAALAASGYTPATGQATLDALASIAGVGDDNTGGGFHVPQMDPGGGAVAMDTNVADDGGVTRQVNVLVGA